LYSLDKSHSYSIILQMLKLTYIILFACNYQKCLGYSTLKNDIVTSLLVMESTPFFYQFMHNAFLCKVKLYQGETSF